MLIKWPTRSRPDLFRRVFSAYRQDETADFLISVDADDPTMTSAEMRAWLDEQPRTTVRVGNSKSKVEAVNAGLAETSWSLVCVASDDMIPQRPDYARRISELFYEFFPDGDGVLHLNDGNVGRRLNTIPIMDRKYFERFDYVYRSGPSGYVSVWCDNEFMDVSERLGRAIYVDEVILRHEWIGAHAPDDLHSRNESFHDRDSRMYQQRKALGFPI